MPFYQVTVTVNVPDVEADSEEDAIKEVETEIASVFADPVRFYAESAVDYATE
jgi:hypothetical protein